MIKGTVVVGYTGRRGAGKTTAMTMDALKYYEAGYNVYSNMRSLSFAHVVEEARILELAENDDFYDCVLVLDEIQILFDSRRAMRKQNSNFLYFIQQIRKRNVHLLYTTQFSRRVDVGIREHTDIEARPRMIEKKKYGLTLCSVSYEDLTVSYETGIPQYRNKVFIANDVFGLFDTTEKISEIKVTKEMKRLKT